MRSLVKNRSKALRKLLWKPREKRRSFGKHVDVFRELIYECRPALRTVSSSEVWFAQCHLEAVNSNGKSLPKAAIS